MSSSQSVASLLQGMGYDRKDLKEAANALLLETYKGLLPRILKNKEKRKDSLKKEELSILSKSISIEEMAQELVALKDEDDDFLFRALN